MNRASTHVLGLGVFHVLMLGAAEEHEERTFRAGSIGRFIKRHRLQMQASRLLVPPAHMERDWEARHYVIILTSDSKEYRTTFSMGMGLPHPPDIVQVLQSIGHDAIMWEQYQGDFLDYAGSFGIDIHDPAEYQKFVNYGKSMKGFREFLGEEAYVEFLSLSEVQEG